MNKNSLIKILSARYNMIKKSCYTSSNSNYKCYGAKGIKMCDEWLINKASFINWAIEKGFKNNSQCIYRVDKSKSYTPENCLVITKKEYESLCSTNASITNNNNKETVYDNIKNIDVEYKTNTFINLYLIEEEVYITKKGLSSFIYGSIGSTPRIDYYERKTVKHIPGAKPIKIQMAYETYGNNKKVYNSSFLASMKQFFKFKSDDEIKRYFLLIHIMNNYRAYPIKENNKPLLNVNEIKPKELDEKIIDTNKDCDKIMLINKLKTVCSKEQIEKFIEPLSKIIAYEAQKEEALTVIEHINNNIKRILE